jgi:predicted MFS family arabinose efflux permease
VLHLFPDLAVSLEVPSRNHGAMLAMMRAVVIGTYLIMHHAAFWRHRFSATTAAQVVGLVGLSLLICTATQTGLTLGLCALGFLLGFNYFASLYYSTTSSHERTIGLAGGIHEATLGLGIAGGSLIGGLAGAAMGPRAPYRLSLVVLTGMFLVQTLVYARGRASRRKPEDVRAMEGLNADSSPGFGRSRGMKHEQEKPRVSS